MALKKEEINTFNDWVKSLRIYMIDEQFLKEEYYESGYDLCCDLRKMLLNKKLSAFNIIYIDRIVRRLDSKSKIRNISVEEDYELSKIIKVVIADEEFRKRINSIFRYRMIMDKIVTCEYTNKVKLLLKDNF